MSKFRILMLSMAAVLAFGAVTLASAADYDQTFRPPVH